MLTSRGQFLSKAGYRVLNSSNGFDAIRLSTSGRVHAVVLDLDRNHEDPTLIAQEIKRLRPEVSHQCPDRGGGAGRRSV
ncbi:MAG: hypothetical protein WA628_19110 [Terriglobales bacterium]